MPKMVCQKCKVEFRPKKNGVYVVEMYSDPPRPYRVWSADAWECPGCEHVVIAGFGNFPMMEHYESRFDEWYTALLESDATVVPAFELLRHAQIEANQPPRP